MWRLIWKVCFNIFIVQLGQDLIKYFSIGVGYRLSLNVIILAEKQNQNQKPI